MILRLATLCAVVLAVQPVSVMAKTSPAQKSKENDAARLSMRDFAECLVRSRYGSRVRNIDAFLAMSPFAPDVDAAAGKFATPDCLKSRDAFSYIAKLQMKAQLLRGALFRARFINAFKARPLPASFAAHDVKARWHVPTNDPFAPLQAIGECVVRGNPAGTRAVIEAPVGSSAEDAAYKHVIPTLQQCMPAGGTFTFSRTVLEGLFAESLYNLSVSQPGLTPAVETK
jgi:hypothetical protein